MLQIDAILNCSVVGLAMQGVCVGRSGEVCWVQVRVYYHETRYHGYSVLVSQRNAFTHLLIFGFFKVEYMYIHSLFAYIR